MQLLEVNLVRRFLDDCRVLQTGDVPRNLAEIRGYVPDSVAR